MDTDHALSIAAGVGLAICGICALVSAWKNNRDWPRSTLKASRSDTDLTTMLDNAIPSGSAMTVRRMTPPDDPTSGPSEERYA